MSATLMLTAREQVFRSADGAVNSLLQIAELANQCPSSVASTITGRLAHLMDQQNTNSQ
ncbi:Uncharacterised protein [Leclercia adecarboxylata]|uniref:Uncharacterized protein n=1 Tax=Leclercia adecarboxylata TaxID=83655 RepID=A0A4U9IJ81_9ENTR|nr:Uncharacterised protein [Leclercia adecarboxylata]